MGNKVVNLTDKQKAFLSALQNPNLPKGSWRSRARIAATEAGYSENTPLAEIMGPLTEEIKQLAEKMLMQASLEAVFTMTDMMDPTNEVGPSDTLKAKIRMEAAKEILSRTVPKREEKVAAAAPSVVIMLPPKEPVKQIEYQDE